MKTDGENLQGRLILDSGKLAGSYFDRTVILICRHDDSGSFGLVLNRPLKKSLGSVVSMKLPSSLSRVSLQAGGPVQVNMLSFLSQGADATDENVLPGLTLGHSLQDLKDSVEDGSCLQVRAYAGYAGWSAGQLADEMKSGCWLVHKASFSLVYARTPETLWKDILKKMDAKHQLLAEMPDNAALN